MKIREYGDADLAALRRMHASQGFAYPFPDLRDPIFISRLVLEDDAGRPAMASLARLTCEMYLLVDRDAEGTDGSSPRQRYAQLLALHDAGARDLIAARTGRRARLAASANRQTIRAAADGAGLDARRRLDALLQTIPFEINHSGKRNLTEDYMSRGAEQSTRNLTDQQLGQQNQLISQANQSGQQDRSLLVPTIQGLLNSQGYTPQQQSDITQQSLGASNTAFDALRQRAANRVAATNNSAGFGDLTAQLGREQAQTDASQAQQNQVAFANQKLKENLAGLSALGQTYGVDTNLLGKAMGVPSELLGVRQRASTGSSTAGLSGLFGAGSSIASLFG